MSALSMVLRDTTDNGLLFWCPGCDMCHRIQHGAGSGPRWTWNQNVRFPSFSPSIRVKFDTLSEAARARNAAFKVVHGRYMSHEELPYDVDNVCHSFVTDGRIQFLSDCTHAFAGETADLPPFPQDW